MKNETCLARYFLAIWKSFFIGQPSDDYMPDDNLHLGKRKEGRGKRDQRPNCFGRESLSVSAQNDRTHTQGLFVCQPQNNSSATLVLITYKCAHLCEMFLYVLISAHLRTYPPNSAHHSGKSLPKPGHRPPAPLCTPKMV